MHVDKNCVVFITVASVQKRKGQFNFVKLLEHLNIPYQYWIVGRGEDEDIIKQYVAEHCTIVGEDKKQQGDTKTSIKSEVRTRLFILVKAIKKGLEKLNFDISLSY